MVYAIRLFRATDAAALADLTLAAIKSVGAHRYAPSQVAAWAARHPGPQRFLDRAAAGEHIFVAVDAQDQPVAYSLLENAGKDGGHLDMLYCHPDYTRKGLAERLLSAAEHCARELRLSRIFTEASELARPAFERAGYAVTHRRDFTIEHDGKDVPIHNFAMEKHLI